MKLAPLGVTLTARDIAATAALVAIGLGEGKRARPAERDAAAPVSGAPDRKRARTERGELVCRVCSKEFSTPAQMKRHARLHTAQRPHACTHDGCNKAFSDASALRTHVRVHTGHRPFACDLCDRRFSQSGHLRTHRRTHTGEKPCMCLVCGRGFAQSSTLRKHMRARHP